VIKSKEEAIYKLGELYARLGRTDSLHKLVVDIRPFFSILPKSRTTKIVRALIDMVGRVPNTDQLQVDLCLNAMAWCNQERRTFLKQRIAARLTSLYLNMQKYNEALPLIRSTAREVKKFDDKLLLVEIEVLESKVFLALGNVPKAKGALTSARSSANAIYCPPLLQAEIDQQAGILCCEEKDFKTGFSYFYEAFEGFNTINNPRRAVLCLKYMMLAKIMLNQAEDVYTIINSKGGIKYAGVEVQAMRAVADVYKKRDIHAFETVYKNYTKQLAEDPVIFAHLTELKDNLLEQTLLRFVEPFSRVQIPHVAKLIDLPIKDVESKLSEMILDRKLNGILDQGSGDLLLFDEPQTDRTYAAAVDTVRELSGVVDKLYAKAKKLQRFQV